MIIVPRNARYVPIPQQPYCCGPASLSMIMLRLNIPLLPQELIGYHLGLVVPATRKNEFWNPRYADKPVVASGFGTQVQNKKFGMQKALDKLGIPLKFTYLPSSRIGNKDDLRRRLKEILRENQDVLLCLQWGKLTDQPEKAWGHILAVDYLGRNDVRLIDTDIGPKWRVFSLEKVWEALLTHGDENYGGLWVFEHRHKKKA